MMRAMQIRTLAPALVAGLFVAGCTLMRAPAFPPQTPAAPPPAGSTAPAASTAAAGAAQATPSPVPEPSAPPPRQFHLSAASTSLVNQAHAQAASGDYAQAAATLERALRIEPDNPLLWIELGRVRLAEPNPAQADAMGHKALALATGDAAAQASAWRLIADSLRACGRNGEAAEADQRAQAASR